MKRPVTQLGREAQYIRYGTHTVDKMAWPRLPVSAVAKCLGVSTKHCYYALKKYQHDGQPNIRLASQSSSANAEVEKVTIKNVTDQELASLVTSEALERQAEQSLIQRASLFTQAHPGRKLTKHHLRAIYRAHGIKRKAVRRRMKSTLSAERQREEQQRFYREILEAEARGDEIVMIDECVFSQKTYQQTAWARRGENLILSKRFSNMNCIAAVAAISNKQGLIAYHTVRKSIKQDDFAYFIEWMASRMKSAKYTLLLDQASIHRAQQSKTAMDGMNVIFNVAYSPWYNGIELYWAQCKQVFRKALLRAMLDNQSINLSRLTDEALVSIDDERVKSCAQSAIKLIKRDIEKKYQR